MASRSPGRIIAVVVAVVVLIGATALWLLVRFDMFPDTKAVSLHPTTTNATHIVVVIEPYAN